METLRSHPDEALTEKSPALSVVIPAYNEAARLVRTLEATAAYLETRQGSYEILIVDDGSRDATARTAAEWIARQHLQLGTARVLSYEPNRGKGHAVRYGILRAVGEKILFMDADLATPIEEIVKLEGALKEMRDGLPIQVAIGSRDVTNSQLLVRQPLYREAAGRLFNKAVQILATPGIHDTQCGFKLLTREAAQAIFSRCTLDGFSFDVEAIYLARRLGYAVAEVPVRWAHQEGAAAFATKGAYLRHGLRMIRDILHIRQTHRGLRARATGVPVNLASDAVLPQRPL
ncbi:MAG: glycosyltransferase family 2 protein [Cytophagales bacterium]|nr:glycosyltransferase family 2 protein [Armatimonadota bacterium]